MKGRGDDANARASEHAAFWNGLKDHEFFGPSVKHVYFYSDVSDESVLTLRQEVLDACTSSKDPETGVQTAPKPIVIHVHSRGGSMYSENWLLALSTSRCARWSTGSRRPQPPL